MEEHQREGTDEVLQTLRELNLSNFAGKYTLSELAVRGSQVASDAFEYLKAPIIRVTLPDTPAPASSTLEKVFYPDAEDIISAVKKVCNHKITRD